MNEDLGQKARSGQIPWSSAQTGSIVPSSGAYRSQLGTQRIERPRQIDDTYVLDESGREVSKEEMFAVCEQLSAEVASLYEKLNGSISRDDAMFLMHLVRSLDLNRLSNLKENVKKEINISVRQQIHYADNRQVNNVVNHHHYHHYHQPQALPQINIKNDGRVSVRGGGNSSNNSGENSGDPIQTLIAVFVIITLILLIAGLLNYFV